MDEKLIAVFYYISTFFFDQKKKNEEKIKSAFVGSLHPYKKTSFLCKLPITY